MDDTLARYPFIEQTKIQAQVLVPLIKAFQAELGEERANQIVRKALGGWIRKAAEQMAAHTEGSAIDKIAGAVPYFAAGDAIDVDVVKKTDSAFELTSPAAVMRSSTRSSACRSSGSCCFAASTIR